MMWGEILFRLLYGCRLLKSKITSNINAAVSGFRDGGVFVLPVKAGTFVKTIVRAVLGYRDFSLPGCHAGSICLNMQLDFPLKTDKCVPFQRKMVVTACSDAYSMTHGKGKITVT